MKPTAIDLFAGCGGFSNGFTQAGFEITHAVEFDATIAETYAKTQIIVDDIKNVDESQILPTADIIIGGPPCQGFSMAGARIRGGFADDSRNYLFKHYFNIVKTVQPKIFVMENVKGIQTMNKGAIFAEIIRLFENIGYNVQYSVFNASDFGVPQNRERMVIMGVRKTEKMGKTDKKAENWDFSACIKMHKISPKPHFGMPFTIWKICQRTAQRQ